MVQNVTSKIPYPVPVRVLEAPGVDLVDDGALPPLDAGIRIDAEPCTPLREVERRETSDTHRQDERVLERTVKALKMVGAKVETTLGLKPGADITMDTKQIIFHLLSFPQWIERRFSSDSDFLATHLTVGIR